jgi:hypothetical protein
MADSPVAGGLATTIYDAAGNLTASVDPPDHRKLGNWWEIGEEIGDALR